jgi:hypothetical protein
MNKNARTIQIYLPDGNAKGIRIATMTRRDIQAILIPRLLLNKAAEINELQNVSLYFLFGEDEEGKEKVYIGEAENGLTRLKDHNKNKDFWNYAVLIVSDNIKNQYTKTDVSFFENHSIEIAKATKRYELENGNSGRKGFIQEWRKADLLNDFEIINLLLTTLGFPIFEQKIEAGKIGNNEEIFYCIGRGAEAKGEMTEEGFVVFEGSTMALKPVPSFIQIDRVILLEKEGYIKREKSMFVFIKDCLFASPSAAAGIVLQRRSNGWEVWKNESGKTLNEIKRANIN